MIAYESALKGDLRLRVEAVSSRTFRVRIADVEASEPGMNRYGFILPQPEPVANVLDADAFLTVETEAASLRVSKVDGAIWLQNGAGHTILQSSEPPVCKRSGFEAGFALAAGSRVYGLGDVTRERLEKTGFAVEMWTENVKKYIPIPFLSSTAGWGLYLNTTWRHRFDVGAAREGELRVCASGGGLDFYLFVGDGFEEILNEYTNLLGKPVMLPRWAYGLTYVCNQKVNDAEMMQECLNFRREGIPCDVCGLEPGWMSKHYDFSVDKAWNPDRFYIPYWSPKGEQTFFGALDRLGFQLSLWLCCDYDLSFEEERQARRAVPAEAAGEEPNADDCENDANFHKKPLSMDPYTKVDEPWFEHLKKFVDQGARCFKLDGANQIVDHPDRKWGNGMDDEEMHNLYPLIYGKQMSQGYANYTGRRSMIYSASGYAGIQRFCASWAGDTGGGPKPLAHMLNHGYSGHVNTSCDMDVFSAGGIHFGFFQPWSQLCNWAYWRQPWFLTPERKEMYRFYAVLRYRMLPYIYTLAHRAATTGYPLMRAMSMEFPHLEKADELLCQYMFGDDMLTAAFAETLVLPQGRWINAWTNETVEGGRTVPASYPSTVGGPLYLREGAVIPTYQPAECVSRMDFAQVEWNLYPGRQARAYELYEDDGETYRYREGAFAITRIEIAPAGAGLTIRLQPRRGQYAGMPQRRTHRINLLNWPNAREVRVNGQAAEYSLRQDGWCARIEGGFVSVPVEETGEEICLEVR